MYTICMQVAMMTEEGMDSLDLVDVRKLTWEFGMDSVSLEEQTMVIIAGVRFIFTVERNG